MTTLSSTRKGQREERTASRLTGDRYGSAVQRHDGTDDRETETGSVGIAGSRLIDAIEAIEQPAEMLAFDPDAGVMDFHAGALPILKDHDANAATGRCVLQCVADEIAQRATKQITVGEHGSPPVDRKRDGL